MIKSSLQQLCEDAGLDVRTYSGRSMYGKQCLGVQADDGISELYADLFQAAADTDVDLQEVADDLRGACQDAMGRGSILYFPSIPFCEEEDEGERELESDENLVHES